MHSPFILSERAQDDQYCTCDVKPCSPNSLQRSEFGAAVGVAILVVCLFIVVIILIAILCWWRWVRERERERESKSPQINHAQLTSMYCALQINMQTQEVIW